MRKTSRITASLALAALLLCNLNLTAAPSRDRSRNKVPTLRERIVKLVQSLEDLVPPKPAPAPPPSNP